MLRRMERTSELQWVADLICGRKPFPDVIIETAEIRRWYIQYASYQCKYEGYIQYASYKIPVRVRGGELGTLIF